MDRKQFEREITYEYLFMFYKNLCKQGIISDFELFRIERQLRDKYRPVIMQINLYSA